MPLPVRLTVVCPLARWFTHIVPFMLALAVMGMEGCREHDVPPAEQKTEAPHKVASSLACFQRQLAPGGLKGWNLLFLTLDTTRADHIGCYGHAAAQTPTIDALAANGVMFDHAITSVPATLPAHCAMMTGLEVPNHGVRTNGHFNLHKDRTTMAEVLRDRGYATAAFVATYVLNKRFGLSQGFDTYDDKILSETGPKRRGIPRRADHQTDVAIKWLTRQLDSHPQQPFFMWVHYFDPHLPYDPPGTFGERFADAPYDGEIAYTDFHLRRLLDFFESRRLLDSTLIVLTADHGEGLFDHLEKDHSRLIYDTTLHVPLILTCPQLQNNPCRVDDITVGTIDIMPTVLSLLGADAGLTMDGFNLLTEEISRDRVIYIETIAGLLYHGWASLHGLRSIDRKFIKAPIPEYYDLLHDPRELDNLLDADSHAADDLATRLEEIMSVWPPVEETARSADRLTERVAKNLAALGYVSTRTAEDAGTSKPAWQAVRPDPKDMVPLFDDLNRNNPVELRAKSWELVNQFAGVQTNSRDDASYRRALILARAAIKHRPNDPVFLTTLAFAQYRTGHYVEAMETLRDLTGEALSSGGPYKLYAKICRVMSLYRLGRLDQAKDALRQLRADMKTPAGRLASSELHDETARNLLDEAESIAGEK